MATPESASFTASFTEAASAQRHIRVALVCLVATVALPLAPILWDRHVRQGVDNLQAARDRLDALRERLAEPQSLVGASLALAEDLVLRRTVSELLDDIHTQQEWCAGADLNTMQHDFDVWFSTRASADPFVHLDGVIDAAVYRSRAAAERAHGAVLGGCLAALISACVAGLSLRRLLQICQALPVRLAPVTRAADKGTANPSLVVSALAPKTESTPLVRKPLPPTLTPPVFRPLAAASQVPSPGQGLPVVAPRQLARLQGRVLVIEDNPINQRVTQRQLMELGLKVEVVATAEIGLARLVGESFDAVLMDLQLPGIDGLTATRRWRAQEVAEGRRRLPIIAITANAMGTDREACYSAGMDGYQAKPARLDDLYRVLVRWVTTTSPTKLAEDGAMNQRPEVSPPPAIPTALNPTLAMLLSTAADAALTDPSLWLKLRSETAITDPRLLEELMADLRQQSAANLAELDAAVNLADHERLRAAAHRLKGSAGMLGLPRLAACAKCVEFAAKAHDQEIAVSAVAELRDAYAKTLDDPAVAALG